MRLIKHRSEVPGTLVCMAAWTVLALQYTTVTGTVAATAGALLGCMVARWANRRSPRLEVVIPGSVVACVLFLMGAHEVQQWQFVSAVLGQLPACELAEILRWGGSAFCFSLGLDLLRPKFHEASAVRVILIVVSFASLLAAHRDGAQQRPYQVVDQMLRRGYDPVDFFLLVGVVIAIGTVVFCLTNPRLTKRGMKDPVLLIALLALLALLLPVSLPRLVLRAQRAEAGGKGAGNGSGQQKSNDKGSAQGGGDNGQKGNVKSAGNGKSAGKGKGSANGSGGSGNSSKDQALGDDGENQDPQLSMTPPPEHNLPVPVAVVTFHNDYDPPSQYYYFRQSVLTLYSHNQLVADETARYEQGTSDGFPVRRTAVPGEIPNHAQLVHLNITLLVPHSRPFGLVTPMSYAPASNPDPKRFERAYRDDSMATSSPYTDLLPLPIANPVPSDPLALSYFTAAPSDPRFAAVANEALAKLPAAARRFPLARAWAIKSWLDANVTYNRQASHAQATDPVADFLFGDRNGYCVHFAQAAALLYRTAGIPARVSQGYAVAARQRGHGASLLIRSGDAHAWPEIYLEGAGWTVVDISAQHSVQEPQEPVDPEQQRMLGDMARGDDKQTAGNEGQSAQGQRPDFLTRLGSMARLALAAVLVAWLLQLYVRKLWRRLAIYICPVRNLPRVGLRAALGFVADAGLLRDSGNTREQFAYALRPAIPGLEVLTGLHAQASLGAVSPQHSRKEYLQLCHNVARQVRDTTPGWRRVLGWLNPATVWRVY
jgi:transglutaminase-like putative cysteine protease